jgi:hypothetical protein
MIKNKAKSKDQQNDERRAIKDWPESGSENAFFSYSENARL